MQKNYFLKAVFTVLLCSFFSLSYAADIYLSTTGVDTNDGTTALTAVASFSQAQTLAASGDIIHVSGMIDFTLDPANTESPQVGITLDKNLSIQGASNTTDGFDGKSLTRFIQTAGFNLTMTNLKLTGGLIAVGNGGAINITGGTISLTNIDLDSNKALYGGAIYVASGTVMLDGCTIQNNDNSGILLSNGGGIYVKPTAAVTLNVNNTLLKNNKTAAEGAAIYYGDALVTTCTMKFTNCAIISNTTGGTTLGGGAFINNSTPSATVGVTFINSTIYDNAAGGISSGGMAVSNLRTGSVIDFRNCTITGNRVMSGTSAGAGAGIRAFTAVNTNGGVVKFYNSILENNYCPGAAVSSTNYTTDFAWQGEGFTAGTNLIIENSFLGRPGSPTNAKWSLATNSFPTTKLNYVSLIDNDVRKSYKAKFAPFNSTGNYLPLYYGSEAINYGTSTYLTSLTPSVTTDQLGNTRPFTDGKCYAGSVEIAPITTAPAAPTTLVATPGDTEISIAFTEGSTGGLAITNYKYSTDNGVTYTALDPAVTTSPIVITGLANNIEYTVKLKAVNANGDGAESVASNAVTPTGTTGLDNVISKVTIFRNSNKQIVVNNASQKTGTITVCNAVGQRVASVTLNAATTTINKSFTSGVYLVMLNIDGKTSSTKIIL
ncbi:MAG: T9SS type A sorting domain-containing protein [Paludibacter sp.]|nr:T9SS type A sorting domain-containing protein [Paludibacter sp.]